MKMQREDIIEYLKENPNEWFYSKDFVKHFNVTSNIITNQLKKLVRDCKRFRLHGNLVFERVGPAIKYMWKV